MRFDLSALRAALPGNTAAWAGKSAAAAGALVAAGTIVYALVPDRDEHAAVDAVVSQKSMFTPVASRATTAAPSEFDRPYDSAPAHDAVAANGSDVIGLTRAVQRLLKRAGCYSGRIDGRWNGETRNAMGAFTEIVNARLPVDVVDPVLLVLLETHSKASCTPGTRIARREETAGIDRQRRDAESATRQERVREEQAAPEPVTREEREAEQPIDTRTGLADEQAREPQLAAVEELDADAESGILAGEVAAAAAIGAAPRIAKADRPRVKRKYRKKNSFSRSVSRNFRKIQRGLFKIF